MVLSWINCALFFEDLVVEKKIIKNVETKQKDEKEDLKKDEKNNIKKTNNIKASENIIENTNVAMIEENWKSIIAKINQLNSKTAIFLENCKIHNIENNVLKLEIDEFFIYF